jgi:hypothetical protein
MTGSIFIFIFAVTIGTLVILAIAIIPRYVESRIKAGIEKFKGEMFIIDEEADQASKEPESGDLLWDESKDWVKASRDKAGWR